MALRHCQTQSRFPVLWLAVLTVLSPGAAARADVLFEKTWTDGICSYDLSLPLDGYFVPATVFEKDYAVTLEKVLAVSRRMTPAELDRYAHGGKPQVTRDYPLFVFKNHKVNVFLWKGKHDGEQQIIPLVWDGEMWSSRRSSDGRADAIEHLFYQPVERDRCYVMVSQVNGQVGRDRIHTERVLFGAFPPVETTLRKGIETADVVVYRVYRKGSFKGELLDCLKGQLTLEEFRKLPGVERVGYNTFVFITGSGDKRKIRSTYTESDVYGTFRGDHGDLSLSIPQVRAAVAKDPSLNAYVEPGPLRWELARSAVEPRQKDAGCRLRLVTPEPRRDEWVVLEVTAGRGRPGTIHRPPLGRAQTDGGDALVRFRIQSGGAEVDLAPRGRFGADSAEERNTTLDIEYQFIACGQGVLKLALRPKRYPWTGNVQGRFDEFLSPFDRSKQPELHVSEIVRLKLK